MSKRLITKLAILGVAVVAATWLVTAPVYIRPSDLPPGMAEAAPQRCIGVFIICMALWFTNLIPLAATGLLAIAMLPLLGILPKEEAFSLFGNSAVFFMLGVFLLAAAMISTGLSKRVTLVVLHRFGKNPTRLVIGVTVSAAFLSLWMPEHAVAAMIFPIITEIVASLKLERGAPYAKKLFLGLAWGSIIGGVGTFLGGSRAPLALEMLHKAHPDARISFLSWMLAAAPIVVVMTAVAVFMLTRRLPNELDDIKGATSMLDERVRRLGPMSGREVRLAGLTLVTIVFWISTGTTIGLGVIAIVAATALFVLRIVEWKDVQGYVNWGVLIMYGGAVALGAALAETKAMEWLAHEVISDSFPPLALMMIMATVAIVLTEGISNAAAVAILLPIGYSLGEMTGVGPIMMTLCVTVASGLAFLLPISSPPNAISFSAGHYSVREVVQLGWPMTVCALIVMYAVIAVWWNMVLHINTW
ncbi:MAG: DASS family sodium-coupled anion symporter [Planctomycetes bacterium]|nr:DASS family sodium-coupled anion symporter [Planctomycetota bacterium]MCH8241961.1 DASS family sodium-coupled anion symporter [Planctomycetota bacterium]